MVRDNSPPAQVAEGTWLSCQEGLDSGLGLQQANQNLIICTLFSCVVSFLAMLSPGGDRGLQQLPGCSPIRLPPPLKEPFLSHSSL